MNPLGVSLIFVICSIFLSFLKHTFFPSESSTVSKFNKVFQLSTSKYDPPKTYYRSLYEAFYKTSFKNSEEEIEKIINRTEFNESALIESFKNE